MSRRHAFSSRNQHSRNWTSEVEELLVTGPTCTLRRVSGFFSGAEIDRCYLAVSLEAKFNRQWWVQPGISRLLFPTWACQIHPSHPHLPLVPCVAGVITPTSARRQHSVSPAVVLEGTCQMADLPT